MTDFQTVRFSDGRNCGGGGTFFGWLARVPAADWSPGDSQCGGPLARPVIPLHLPAPSRLCSVTPTFSLRCFLSSQLCQLMSHLPPSPSIHQRVLSQSSPVIPLLIIIMRLYAFCPFSSDSCFFQWVLSLLPSNSASSFPYCWKPTVIC